MSAVIEKVAAADVGHHQWISLTQLAASPLNHRKIFDKVKLEELAASIRAQGVIQPIIARPLLDKFEVVAGERRFRAAKLAQLAVMPAVVRELTDAQALELQVVENAQRADPHPLEEAEGFEALLKCSHPNGEKYTVDEIAAKVGKSRSYVFARLKLLALCPEARKAFYEDQLDASRALLIARIGHHDTQRQALKDIQGDSYDGPMSYREARDHLVLNYTLQLKTAVFDIKDANLAPKAGACAPCLKRSGNAPDLFGDVKGADVCTDPKCFGDKRLAHFAKAAQELEAKGKKVLYGEEAKKVFPDWDSQHDYERDRLLDRYVPMSGHTWIGSRQRAVREVLGSDYEPTFIQHPATGKVVEVATQQAIDAAAKKGKTASATTKAAKASAPSKPKGPDVDQVLTERLATLIHEKSPKQFGKPWLQALAQQLQQHLSTRDLDAVALAWGWKGNAFKSGYSYTKKLPADAMKLNERDLVLLMFDFVFAIGQYTRGPVLKLFGIDEPKVREQIIEERKKARTAGKKPPAKAGKGLAALGIKPLKPGQKIKPLSRKTRPAASFMKPMTPSAELAAIVGDKPLARTEITSKLWGYIKKNDLQDKTNRRMINVDAKLAAIAAKAKQKAGKQFSMFEMTKIVAKNIS